MLASPLLLSLATLGQPAASHEPAHAANPVFHAVVAEGITLDGRSVRLPEPRFHDGQAAAAQDAELARITGSQQGVAEFLRDSVSAPIIVKLKDESTPEHVIRHGSVWFALHAGFDAIDPDRLRLESKDSRPVEAGNMRFTSHVLEAAELSPRGIDLPKDEGFPRTWYVHLTGRLLDRIHVEETEQSVASRSDSSWIVASRTERRFDKDSREANRWWPIVRKGSNEQPGPAHPFVGGASYVKISRLASDPGVLVAEAQFALAEPRAWFDGAPILRSKISVIAQDQVRRLRRDLAARKAKSKGQ